MGSNLPIPNPGSPEALAQGCRCPVFDNAHGLGYMGGVQHEGETLFVYSSDCELHRDLITLPMVIDWPTTESEGTHG